MASVLAVLAWLTCLLACAPSGDQARLGSSAAHAHPSRAVGLPWSGRLVGGVPLARRGRDHLTWDPVRRRVPNRPERLFATRRTVHALRAAIARYRRAHRRAPRVLVGDLSRERGGGFGARFGLPGHVSHQNGLDVDVYYPRADGREIAPVRAVEIDVPLSRALLGEMLAAGPAVVFVGPSTGLAGGDPRVQPLAHHGNHMHVRFGPAAAPGRPRPGGRARRDGSSPGLRPPARTS